MRKCIAGVLLIFLMLSLFGCAPMSEVDISDDPAPAPPAPTPSSDDPAPILVLVQNADGTPISGAAVTTLWIDGFKGESAVSDGDGAVGLDSATPGTLWLGVHADGYRQYTDVAAVTSLPTTISVTLEPAAATARYVMAAEAGGAADGEKSIVLFESDDGLSWRRSDNQPDTSGTSPDVIWHDGQLVLTTGSASSMFGLREPVITTYNPLTGSWRDASLASFQADDLADDPTGSITYSYLTREACFFTDDDGSLGLYGANFPNGSFRDLDIYPEFDETRLTQFVSGIANGVPGYGANLFHCDGTRYRLIIRDSGDAGEPDVFRGADGWYMLLERAGGIQLFFTADLGESFAPAPQLLDGYLYRGESGSACGFYDGDEGLYHIYIADASGASIRAYSAAALTAEITDGALTSVIDAAASGVDGAAFIANPGVCLTGAPVPLGLDEPFLLNNSEEEFKTQSIALKEDWVPSSYSASASSGMEDGLVHDMKINLPPDLMAYTIVPSVASGNFAMQGDVTPEDGLTAGFAYNLIDDGLEREGYLFTIGDGKWSLRHADFRDNILYTLGFMGLKPPVFTTLAEGTLDAAGETVTLTVAYTGGTHWLFADGALLARVDEDPVRRTAGALGFVAAAGNPDGNSYLYEPYKIIRLG